jgi:hypothetical protein
VAQLPALSWVALPKLERPEWRRLDLAVLGAAADCQILFNTARIYVTALSLEQFLCWHDRADKKLSPPSRRSPPFWSVPTGPFGFTARHRRTKS